jgi:hypothetical protein
MSHTVTSVHSHTTGTVQINQETTVYRSTSSSSSDAESSSVCSDESDNESDQDDKPLVRNQLRRKSTFGIFHIPHSRKTTTPTGSQPKKGTRITRSPSSKMFSYRLSMQELSTFSLREFHCLPSEIIIISSYFRRYIGPKQIV